MLQSITDLNNKVRNITKVLEALMKKIKIKTSYLLSIWTTL